MPDQELKLLNSLYKNASMGTSTIKTILPKVKNPQLCQELETQLDNYQESCRSLQEHLAPEDIKSDVIKKLTQTYTDTSVMLSTMMDSSASHIAEMMIQGTNMGVIEITKALNSDKNAPSSLKSQAESMLKKEQRYIDKLKYYL